MSIDRNTANADTMIALAALTTAVDTAFIADVDSQITQAIAMSQFQVTAMTGPNVNLSTVYAYYAALGYQVSFPDYQNQNGPASPSIMSQPVNLFGYNWIKFWENAINVMGVRPPARMTIAWS